jgi:antitoxin component YwqK of YwqJK toxin-antitoxin module
MKNILYTLALLVCFYSFGQDDIKQGLVIEYYESGEVKSKVNYVDGKEQGELIEYYESGEVKLKVSFEEGKAQGEIIIEITNE